MPRAATILIVGVAVLLVGGFGIGVLVGRKPPPAPTASESLPPVEAPPPPQQASATIPPELPRPKEPPTPAPQPVAPVQAPPPTPAVQPAPARPVPSLPVRSEPTPIPQEKPAPPPAAAPAKPAPPRQVAAALPTHELAPSPRRSAPKPAAAVPRKPKQSSALPQPVGGGRWVVQVGAFQSDDHAKLLVDTLAYHGHAARIAGGHDRSGRDWYFVQTPGYATREDAEAVARHLARTEHVPTYVFETRPPP